VKLVAASAALGAALLTAALSLAALTLAEPRYAAAYAMAARTINTIPRLDPRLLREAAAAYTRLAHAAPSLEAAAGLYTRLYPQLRRAAEVTPLLLNLTETPGYQELVKTLQGLSVLSPEAAKAAALLRQLPGLLRGAEEAARLVEEMPPPVLNQTLEALTDMLEKLPPEKLNQTLTSLLQAQQLLNQLNQTLAKWPPERLETLLKATLVASTATAGLLAALVDTWLNEACSSQRAGGAGREK